MSALLSGLINKKLINPPSWLVNNCSYLTVMGSTAYGTDTDFSDFDIYGFAIPPKTMIFKHLAGYIEGFGTAPPSFDQWQQHHILDQEALGGKGREYDFTIFSIVKYFHLVMENNPNCIDSLFTARECVLHCTEVGNMVRDNRRIFLHKGCFHKFKGYALSQLHKMNSKNPIGKRVKYREEFGFDVKFATHLVRLLGEAEQILLEGDIDLRRNSEHLKAIRRGEIKEDEIRKWASDKELQLEKIYSESKLPNFPDEQKIKMLLMNCLEHHYGSLEKAVVIEGKHELALQNIKRILEENGI